MLSLIFSLEFVFECVFIVVGECQYEYVILEYLLLVLIDDEDVIEVMSVCKVDIVLLKQVFE